MVLWLRHLCLTVRSRVWLWRTHIKLDRGTYLQSKLSLSKREAEKGSWDVRRDIQSGEQEVSIQIKWMMRTNTPVFLWPIHTHSDMHKPACAGIHIPSHFKKKKSKMMMMYKQLQKWNKFGMSVILPTRDAWTANYSESTCFFVKISLMSGLCRERGRTETQQGPGD